MTKIRLGDWVEKYRYYYLPAPAPMEAREISLATFFENEDLWKGLFQGNVFFHAKIGFYEPILFPLLAKGKECEFRHKVVHTIKNLPRAGHYDYLVLLPFSSSQAELNTLIAKVLEVGIPVWVVAPFSLVARALLINFRAFFLRFHSSKEFKDMLTLFDFQDSILSEWVEERLRTWVEPGGVSLFITNLSWGEEGETSRLLVKELLF